MHIALLTQYDASFLEGRSVSGDQWRPAEYFQPTVATLLGNYTPSDRAVVVH
ncbi:hypothetical protein SAMN04487949_1097 [Halogranum gelatinilyticum]|uniref:Uncharacterized protein n=1 Tax=Halogranum gelatinilyticum TaxID=660521 RepID=A0A1G9R038_9EURY|nr:hypothetical protein SAMN04487949_1097 [Halogranum gelatinilyticum]